MPTLTNGNQQKLKTKKRKLNRNINKEKIVIEAFENEKEVDDEGSSLMIPSEIINDESSLQSKYLKHLDRHLVLVLNADYQVRI
jgi:broad-specificity NMP kinase